MKQTKMVLTLIAIIAILATQTAAFAADIYEVPAGLMQEAFIPVRGHRVAGASTAESETATDQVINSTESLLNNTNTQSLFADAGHSEQINALASQLGNVQGEVREVAAQSAALAGIRFDGLTGEEGEKLAVAASYGGYRGEGATAVGIAYKPTQNVMLSASTTLGKSHMSFNAGVSYKFGNGKTAPTRASLQKQIKAVSDQNATLATMNNEMHKEVMSQKNEISTLRSENMKQNQVLQAQNEAIKQLTARLEKLEAAKNAAPKTAPKTTKKAAKRA